MQLGKLLKIVLSLAVIFVASVIAFSAYRTEKASHWRECAVDVTGNSGHIAYKQRHVPDEVDMVYERKLKLESGSEVSLPSSPCDCGVGLANYYVSPEGVPEYLKVRDGLYEYYVNIKDNRILIIGDPRKVVSNQELARLRKSNWTYIGRIEGLKEAPVFVPATESKEEVF
ncbi:MAG: hypothetical protein HZC51_11325 [Nitrospirae bacterium]|nr:hypothetical protein [Nitrospirota bacterium]